MIRYLLIFVAAFFQLQAYANDECINARVLTPGTSCNYTYTSFSGMTMSGPAPACATTASQDIWYKFTATDETMSITLSGEVGVNHGFELIRGGCNGTILQCVNNNGTSYAEGYVNNDFIPGQEYYIRVFNASQTLSTISFGICVRKYPSPANDICANATEIIPALTTVNSNASFSGALMDGGNIACAPTASQDIWYKFTATDSTMSITLSGEVGVNHGFELIKGDCNGTILQCVNNNGTSYSEGYINNDFIPGQVYYIRVFNASSSLNTTPFGISVRKYPKPVNDDCANAMPVLPATTCTYIYGSFSGSMLDGGASSCAPSISQDIWYKFIATDSTMSITLSGEVGLNHGFEIFKGNCNGQIMQCVNSYGISYAEGYINNNFIPGQLYYVRVFNASSTLNTSSPFGICIRKYPKPSNDDRARAYELVPVTSCGSVYGSFSGSMLDGGNASCATTTSQDVWYKFTATDSTMSITIPGEVGMNHGFEIIKGNQVLQCVNSYGTSYAEGYINNNFIPGEVYYIRVFNTLNTLSTITFSICVRKYPKPANDDCSSASELVPNTTCTYTYGSFSGSMPDGSNVTCATTASQDIWYKFTATDATMGISLTGESGLNHGFEIIRGGCNGQVLECINANGTSYAEGYFNNNFIPGQVYYIRVFNTLNTLNTTTFGICIRKYPKPNNDACAYATELIPGSSCNFVSGTFSGAMQDGDLAACAPTASQDVWYRFVATSTNMAVQLNAVSSLNHGFQVFDGGCNGTQLVCVNQQGSGNNEYSALNSLVVGNTYYVRVFNVSASPTVSTFGICVTGPAPVSCTPSVEILTEIATACTGENVVFTALPTYGGTTPFYQWKVNGTNAGTNSPVFTSSTLINGSTVSCVMVGNASCSSPVTVNSNVITMNLSGQAVVPAFTQVPAICSGRSFSLPVTSTNGITGVWSPAINNAATTTYTFTPNSGQCAVSTTMTVTVTNNVTPTFTQIPAICEGVTFVLPATSTNGITGIWSPAVNNTVTTTYIFTPDAGQCATTASMTVTVNNGTAPLFTQVPSICSGGTFTLPATSTNGITGTWSPVINNRDLTMYTFTPDAGQCASTTTMTVIVNNIITPSFTQIPAICAGSSLTLPTTSNNGVVGTWSPAVNNNVTTTYTFTPNVGQCASTVTMTVAVNTTSVTPSFTQVPAICVGGTFTLPLVSNNGISGRWSPAINNNVTTTYTFTPNAGQCAIPATMTVDVNTASIVPTFVQIPAICAGSSLILPSTSTNGISGTWSPAVNNTATTTYTFTPNAGQCGTTTTMTVAVNGTSVVPSFTQIPAICAGEALVLPSVSVNGIRGTWSPAINNTTTTTYTFTPDAGQCASTATMTVAVNNGETPVFNQISAVCSGEIFTLPSTSVNGISGTWSPAVNNTATTTYTFTPASGQCTGTATMTVVVNTVNTTVTVQGNTLTAAASGAVYQWIHCSTNQPVPGATSVSFTPSENGSYAVKVTQNGCTEISSCIEITTLGVEVLKGNGWNVYPNPAADQLMVEVNETIDVEITDIAGKVILTEHLKPGVNSVDVSLLNAGVYFIQSASGSIVKFMKK